MTDCVECKNLNRVFESELSKYRRALSAVLYRISTKFAARQQVDMERAKDDLEEHLLTCPSPSRMPSNLPVSRVHENRIRLMQIVPSTRQ